MMTVTVTREKETARTVRFVEKAAARGEPEAVGTVYLQKWAWTRLGQPAQLQVTLHAEAPFMLTFTADKETRNSRQFVETSVAEGRPEVVGSLYVQKWACNRLGASDRSRSRSRRGRKPSAPALGV